MMQLEPDPKKTYVGLLGIIFYFEGHLKQIQVFASWVSEVSKVYCTFLELTLQIDGAKRCFGMFRALLKQEGNQGPSKDTRDAACGKRNRPNKGVINNTYLLFTLSSKTTNTFGRAKQSIPKSPQNTTSLKKPTHIPLFSKLEPFPWLSFKFWIMILLPSTI